MNWDIIAIIISVGALAVAILSWLNSRRTTLHHILEDIRKDYRSPEMHSAVKRLWQFYRLWGKDFVQRYEETRQEDEKQIPSLSAQNRIEAERNTLHYQRRLVSHFYQYVAALYVNGILPKGIVAKTWSEADLKIIPEILVPIENKLREVLNTPPLPPLNERNFSPLVLYKDLKDR
jgi:hypothetical protein